MGALHRTPENSVLLEMLNSKETFIVKKINSQESAGNPNVMKS